MTCSATRSRRAGAGVLAAVAVVALAGCGTGGAVAPSSVSAADLSNPLLSPEHSQWLVGAIAEMATPEEKAEFLGLRDDAAAAAFIEAFWERRKPYPLRPDNPLRETFEARAAEADRLYSEAGYLGRRTARGTIHVLYGPPPEIDYQLSPHPDDPPVTVWQYPEGSPAGLNGEIPERLYRFIKRGDLTELYTPRRAPVIERPEDRRSPGVFPALQH